MMPCSVAVGYQGSKVPQNTGILS